MSSRPLNDDEVLSEMNKLVAFIKQEALEKVREIRVKADEEFAIEKAKIVKQESQAIDALYEKKRKGAEVAQKITQSTQTNKSRLRLLQAREQHLQDLFETARNVIVTLSHDEAKYAQLIESTIVQGLLQMLEPDVTVLARPKDASLVQRVAVGAKSQYKEISGRDVNIWVEGTLSDDSAGGIRLVSASKRITIDNALDERLRLLENHMLPEIRRDLFGTNENRKFYS